MSYLFKTLYSKRRFRQLVVAILILAVVCTLLIVPLEISAQNTHFHNLFDAIWWVLTTIISGGYGDVVPVTVAGRIVGILLQLATALFSVIFVVVGVTMAQSTEHFHFHRIQERLDEIDKKLDKLDKRQQALHRLDKET